MQPMRRSGHGSLRVAAAALLVGILAVPALAGDREKMVELYEKGAKLFRMGKYGEAKAAFEAMVALDPTGEDALVLRERAGTEELVVLWGDERFRKAIQVILDRSMQRSEELREDVQNIEQYVKQLGSDDTREVWKAIYSLKRIGPVAVPFLLEYLASRDAPQAYSPAVSARLGWTIREAAPAQPLAASRIADASSTATREPDYAFSASTSGPASGSAAGFGLASSSSTGKPTAARTSYSTFRAISGFSLRYRLAFSLPCPSRSPP